ncbi:uncharacterized protein V6R79_006303 [Siganus canaliculatus]
MRSFILVAVLLQLAAIITHTTAQYQFGDIVAFPRKCFSTDKKSEILYGVYVGGGDAPNVNQKKNDIFYVSGTKLIPKCTFGTLSKMRGKKQEVRFNGLDETEGLTPKSKEEMSATIKELTGFCKKFEVTPGNSEYLATLVRYGERISLQLGGKLERLGPERSELKSETRQKLESIECQHIKKQRTVVNSSDHDGAGETLQRPPLIGRALISETSCQGLSSPPHEQLNCCDGRP